LSGICHVRNIPQVSDKCESEEYYIFRT
jgi:hypothetical protein